MCSESAVCRLMVVNTVRKIECAYLPIRKKKRSQMHDNLKIYLVADFETWLTEMCAPICVSSCFAITSSTANWISWKQHFALDIFSSVSNFKSFTRRSIHNHSAKCLQTQNYSMSVNKFQMNFHTHIKTKKSHRSSQIHFSSHPDWLWRPTFD